MLSTPIDLVRKSVALYKANKDLFASYVKLLFVFSVVPIILSSVVDVLSKKSISESVVPAFTAVSLLSFLAIIASAVGTLWIALALIRVVAARYEGQDIPPTKAILQDSSQLLLPAIFASILSGLAILGGFILLIIPGIIFSIWFSFTMYAVVLDGGRGTKALSMSKHLVAGRWWTVLVRLLIPGLLFGLVVVIAQSIIGIPGTILLKNMAEGSLPHTFVTLVMGCFVAAVAAFITPLSTGAQTILYMELTKTMLPSTMKDAPHEPLSSPM